MFMAPLFVRAPNGNKSGGLTNEVLAYHESYSVIQRNKPLIRETTRTSLEVIMLSGKRPSPMTT